MSNLRIADKVYPSVDYNGGMVWVDDYKQIKVGDRVLIHNGVVDAKNDGAGNIGYVTVDGVAFIYFRPCHNKIIAQTPDLKLEGVPVVQVVDEFMALLRSTKLEHHVSDDCWFSCPMSHEGCCDKSQKKECNCGADEHNKKVDDLIKGYKAAQSKVTYTEEQVLKAMNLSWKRGVGQLNHNPQEIITSIQPEIVVMTEETFYDVNGKKLKGVDFNTITTADGYEKMRTMATMIKMEPITEQRNGRTYFKIKEL